MFRQGNSIIKVGLTEIGGGWGGVLYFIWIIFRATKKQFKVISSAETKPTITGMPAINTFILKKNSLLQIYPCTPCWKPDLLVGKRSRNSSWIWWTHTRLNSRIFDSCLSRFRKRAWRDAFWGCESSLHWLLFAIQNWRFCVPNPSSPLRNQRALREGNGKPLLHRAAPRVSAANIYE